MKRKEINLAYLLLSFRSSMNRRRDREIISTSNSLFGDLLVLTKKIIFRVREKEFHENKN